MSYNKRLQLDTCNEIIYYLILTIYQLCRVIYLDIINLSLANVWTQLKYVQ